MTYNLYAVRVFSYRWQASRDFYADTIGLEPVFCDEDMGWAQFDLNGAYLGLERCDPDDPDSAVLVGRFAGVSIEVESISDTYEALCAKGVDFLGPPERQPWGGEIAHFYDPDDNVMTLLGAGDQT